MKKVLILFMALNYAAVSLAQTAGPLTNRQQAVLIKMEIDSEQRELNDISTKMKVIKEYIETKSLPIYVEHPALAAISAVVAAEVVTVMAARAKASWRAALAESCGYVPCGAGMLLGLSMLAVFGGTLYYVNRSVESHYGSTIIKMTPAQINTDFNRLLQRAAELTLSIDKKTQEISRLQST